LKIYCRHPFNTSLPVTITQQCGPDHPGAKDLRIYGIKWKPWNGAAYLHPGTKVYAMESGIVRKVRRHLPHCPDTNNCPLHDNMVLVEGPDGFYTQYGHVTVLGVREGSSIQIGSYISAWWTIQATRIEPMFMLHDTNPVMLTLGMRERGRLVIGLYMVSIHLSL
jgi:Peptidase family M23